MYGLTILPSVIKKDDVELNFLKDMKTNKIKNYSYELVTDSKEPYKLVIDLVNYGEVNFNFVVIYNKIKPFLNSTTKSDKHLLPNINIINHCKSNICIYSGL